MVDQSIVDEWLAKADEDYLFTEKYLQDDTRYPTVWPAGYTKDDAVTALAAAGRIREFVKAKLSH